jgi:DNA binding domain, excisionase family
MPEILTAQDIADYLRISRKRVYELFQLKPANGGIPNFSVGKSRRVDRSDFERWLANRKQTDIKQAQ